ncbi:MAG: GumC family protein [Geminicoccaceae bacterium]
MTSKPQRDNEDVAKSVYYGSGYAYGGLADGESDISGGFSLADLIGLLRRRWEIIVVCAAVGTIGATAWGFLFQTVTYEATAQLLIEPEHRVVDLDSVVEGVGSDAATIETQLNLFKSRGFLEGFVDGRVSDRDRATQALNDLVHLKDAGESKSRKINAAHAAEPDETQYTGSSTLDISQRAADIAAKLTVSQQGRSFLINVGYTSTNPYEAAKTANELATYYIDEQATRRRNVTGDASSFLENRLKELEAELLEAEEALHRYRTENPTSTQGAISVTDERLSDITSLLVQTRAQRKDKDARLAYMQSLKKKGSKLDSLTEVLNSPYIASLWEEESGLRSREAELRLELGVSHPKIIALNEERSELRGRIDAEIDKIIDNAANELQVLVERERSLEQDMQALSDIANKSETSTNHAAIRLRLLEGKAETSRRIYEEFLIRLKQTRQQEAIVQANTRLVASAQTPTMPSSTSPNKIFLLGLLGSSGLGFGFAYLLDQLDRRLRNAKEITRALNVPCLGLVPYIHEKARNKEKLTDYLTHKRTSRFAEALRSVYMQIIINNEVETASNVLQVTSAVPDEGKTTFAVNLATMLALDGRKVLLLDLDLRNPSVHQEVNLEDARSFASYLQGKSKFDDSMRAKLKTGCHVIALKSPAEDPGKLLQSATLKNLINRARETYEFIVIDGPPSLGLSDSKTLLPLVDSLIFIVRWNSTKADQAVEAIEELKRCNAHITGAVLTQVNLKQQKRYGYLNSDSYYKKNSVYYKD